MAEHNESAVAKLQAMAEMQDAHNIQVHPDWREQGYGYYRAIWVECAEMLDHFGWKWWKAQSPDLEQVKLELVDIWHFALSELMRANSLSDEMGSQLASIPLEEGDAERFRCAIEDLAQSALQTKSFELEPFIEAMRSLPMSYDELFDLYIGKNVLNHFRQDHGYKTGEYKKVWQGREDNEHLIELLDDLAGSPKDLPELLYKGLEARYPQ
ncbi:MAG: dimeric dUTPase (all-alpha-NTP-PPase superfamily) [Limisphaerales bacterium]|jgi:dimeric dUTPase (all-alpha-NTP-PPase superfamily)